MFDVADRAANRVCRSTSEPHTRALGSISKPPGWHRNLLQPGSKPSKPRVSSLQSKHCQRRSDGPTKRYETACNALGWNGRGIGHRTGLMPELRTILACTKFISNPLVHSLVHEIHRTNMSISNRPCNPREYSTNNSKTASPQVVSNGVA